MWCGTVFIILFITLASCRNIPEHLQDESRNFAVTQDDAQNSNDKNALFRKSSETPCINEGNNNDCKGKGIERLLPPQMPKLKGFVNEDERTWLQSPYQVNHYANAGTLGVGVGSHGGVLYPYAHPNLFAALNPAMPVSSLPPVHTTQIREVAPYLIPHLYTLPRTRFPRGDEEDDFFDQLTHDAIMTNVLPTMPVPMTRSSYGSQAPLIAPAPGPAIALYRTNSAGCGIPLLLSCSPSITKGVLGVHKHQEPIVIKKYRAEHPKAKEEENTKVKSSDPEELGLPENLQQ